MLAVGQTFAGRYQLRRILGTGGMGTVFEAWDTAVDAPVALKVIRTDSESDPTSQDALRLRFKQELRLARQVTHPNVIRIHDLGEDDQVLYITMALVQGEDLATLLKRNRAFTMAEALDIGRQIAAGLESAHAAGVIHRDLKPANVMVTAEGRALIMDFGIARSVVDATGPAVTGQGAVLGTLGYMAPEQAAGVAADERADIYALGLILYELLGGTRQRGPSGVNDLLRRMQQTPAPLHSIHSDIPARVSNAVTRCLQPNPADRYQSVSQVFADIDGQGPVDATAAIPATAGWMRSRRWIAAGAAGALLVAAMLGYAAWGAGSPEDPAEAVSAPRAALAVIPFSNVSGDASLDAIGVVLTHVISTGFGQSSSIRLVATDRVTQVLKDLRLDSATLQPADLRRLADLTSATHFLSGKYTRLGNMIRIDVTLADASRNAATAFSAQAAGEDKLLEAAAEVVSGAQARLSEGSQSLLREMQASAWRPSTSSMAALSSYSQGLDLQRSGRSQEAAAKFEEAVAADDRFALALSALAVATAAQGRQEDAVTLSTRALDAASALPWQERYKVMAAHYRLVNDQAKAIEAYEMLAKNEPASSAAHFDLGVVYEQARKLDQAQTAFEKVLELDAKNADALLALGRVAIRRGTAPAALDPLMKAHALSIQLNNDRQRANILQAIGIAYRYMDRRAEALRNYEESLALKRTLGDKRGMAASYGEIAVLLEAEGKAVEAERTHRSALALQRELGDKAGISVTLINLAGLFTETLGRPDSALPLLREALQLRREVGNAVGEALALNSLGNTYLAKGDLLNAQTYFERALEIYTREGPPNELANVLHNLGVIALRRGRPGDALSRLQQALELRRTAQDQQFLAVELLALGGVFDAQGRFGAAVTSKRASLAAYRALGRRENWLAEILGGLAYSLNQAGSLKEANGLLNEAMQVARELDNRKLVLWTLVYQSENEWLSGRRAESIALSKQALLEVPRVSDPSTQVSVELHDASIAARAAPSAGAAARLARIARDASAASLPRLQMAADLERIATLMKIGSAAPLAQELSERIKSIEAMGNRLQSARAYFLLAELRASAKIAGSGQDYDRAHGLLSEIAAEPGAEAFLQRSDIAAMYAEAGRRGSVRTSR